MVTSCCRQQRNTQFTYGAQIFVTFSQMWIFLKYILIHLQYQISCKSI